MHLVCHVCHEVSQIHRDAVKKFSMARNVLETHHSCLKPVHTCIHTYTYIYVDCILTTWHDLRTSENLSYLQPNHWDDLAKVDSNFSHTVTAWVIQHSHLMEHNERKRIKTFWWFWAVKFGKNVILVYIVVCTDKRTCTTGSPGYRNRIDSVDSWIHMSWVAWHWNITVSVQVTSQKSLWTSWRKQMKPEEARHTTKEAYLYNNTMNTQGICFNSFKIDSSIYLTILYVLNYRA